MNEENEAKLSRPIFGFSKIVLYEIDASTESFYQSTKTETSVKQRHFCENVNTPFLGRQPVYIVLYMYNFDFRSTYLSRSIVEKAVS